jgi:mannose-6-phosphate isomerase-like protein (cupin superfamily)
MAEPAEGQGFHRRSADVAAIEEPSNALALWPLLRHGDTEADLSITRVRLDGHHRRLRTDTSARVYFVIEGGGTMTIGDDAPSPVADGDVVVVPRGMAYHLDGPLTYLVLNTPAFREGDDVYLEAEAPGTRRGGGAH